MNPESKVVVIVQCRLSSTRLPGKALLKLNGKTLLEWNLRAMKKVQADEYVLATDFASEEQLKPVAEKCGFKIFAGSRDDVLLRFCNAIREYKADIILRATADNPFLFYEACNDLYSEYVKRSQNEKIDYITFTGLPHGSGIELFTAAALLKAIDLTQDPYDHEHVGPSLYNHKDHFNSLFVPAKSSYFFPELRSTVDTYADYRRALRVVSKLKAEGVEDGPYSFNQIITALTDEQVKNPVLYIPCTEKGKGTGHLRRCIELAVQTRGDLYIPEDYSLEETQPLLDEAYSEGLEKWQVINHIVDEKQYKLAVCDLFNADEKFIKSISENCSVCALDEGNDKINSVDYYLDIIPSLSGKRNINYSNPEFIKLPVNCHQERVSGKNIKNALVTFGGEDPAALTRITAVELLKLKFQVTVIYPGKTDEELLAIKNSFDNEEQKNLILLPAVKNLREELYKYDLIFTHYGFTAFEARKAKCMVLLGSTSSYHRKLSEKYGFICLDKDEITAENIKKKLDNSNNTQEEIISPQSLPDYIRKIAAGKRLSCPVCQKKNVSDPVVFRIRERTFRRCKKCGMLYISWTGKAIQTEYNHDYFFADYEKQYGKTYLEDFASIKSQGIRRISNVSKVMKKKADLHPSVLDIGCAMGPFLSAAYEKGYTPYGTDIAEDAVEYVKKSLNFPCVKASFPNIDPLKDFNIKNFDVVTMWYVIEHFQNLRDVLIAVNKLLKKGGCFAFSTPSASGVSAKYNREKFFQQSPSDHYSLWQPERAAKILRKFGFKIVKIVPTGIHPERFPECREHGWSMENKEFQKLAEKSVKKILGDTFEVYCKKISDIKGF